MIKIEPQLYQSVYPEIDVRLYTNLTAAVAAIGSNAATLLIPDAQTITADLTIPATTTVHFLHGGTIAVGSGLTLTINGSIEAGLYRIFVCSGTGKVVFGMGSVLEINPKWFGATGDGTTDDTVAIQLAFDSSESGADHLLPIRISPGTYVISSVTTYGKLDTSRNGGAIRGTSFKTTEFVYTGLTSDGPLRVRNVAGFIFDGIRIRGTTIGAFGFWYDMEGAVGAGYASVSNFHLSNFVDGIRWGHDPGVSGDMNAGQWSTFINVELWNCTNGFRGWGVNSDDLVFIGFYTLFCHYSLRITGLHHITIKGGGADNDNTDTTNAFLYADGVREGLTSIENLRIEAGNQLVWLGETAGDSVNNQFPHNLVVRNVAYASYPTGNTTTELIRYGCVGTVTVEDCRLAAPDGYFSFIDFRSDRFATFNLINTGLINVNPEAPNLIVRVTNASVDAETGGVLVHMRGNHTLDDDTIYRPNARIVDKDFLVTPHNANDDTETLLFSRGNVGFPATQIPSDDVNMLDDYEEGTKVVAFTAGTSGTITIDTNHKTLAYTKIGRQVTVTGYLNVSSVSSPVGVLKITGLPFTSISGDTGYAAAAIYADGLVNTAITSLQGDVPPGDTVIVIRRFEAGVATDMAACVQANTFFYISLTYFTT